MSTCEEAIEFDFDRRQKELAREKYRSKQA